VGANRGDVLALVLREAGILLAAGLVIGTGLAIAVGRITTSMLFGLKPTDPVTIGLSVGLLAVVAMVASFLPAMRAAKLEPMLALREE
jgi:ABC-type antimicrobial peptide transport system permease subunit